MENENAEYRLIDDTDGSSVLGADVSGRNIYLTLYGTVIDGKPVSQLEVGESCLKRYSLSGQRSTVYRVLRVK